MSTFQRGGARCDDDAEASRGDEKYVGLGFGLDLRDCIVVGDSVWDLLGARRAKPLGIALLCSGYGQAELERAGAYRVYKHPADLLDHLAEIGIDTQ